MSLIVHALVIRIEIRRQAISSNLNFNIMARYGRRSSGHGRRGKKLPYYLVQRGGIRLS